MDMKEASAITEASGLTNDPEARDNTFRSGTAAEIASQEAVLALPIAYAESPWSHRCHRFSSHFWRALCWLVGDRGTTMKATAQAPCHGS
jgi:hypothetical protein